MLEEQALDPTRHHRQGFTCSVAELGAFLHRYAQQRRQRGVAAPHVLVNTAAPARIPGYYTLSAAEVDATRLTEAQRQRLSRFPIPCFRLGRLACRSDARGLGLGKLLLAGAVDRCLQARRQVAAYALVVDAKDDDAAVFYRHFGFMPLQASARTLYVPLGRQSGAG